MTTVQTNNKSTTAETFGAGTMIGITLAQIGAMAALALIGGKKTRKNKKGIMKGGNDRVSERGSVKGSERVINVNSNAKGVNPTLLEQ